MIQGVNQKSLSLLIEEPTGMISARNRKLSQSNTPLLNQSGMISPGYQSIIHSARREAAADLNFEIGGTMSPSGASMMKLASQ